MALLRTLSLGILMAGLCTGATLNALDPMQSILPPGLSSRFHREPVKAAS
jgi:hypothetical protein